MQDDRKNQQITFEMIDARVVATLDQDGGAVVASIPRLVVDEGRVVSFGTDGKGKQISSMEYMMSFYPADAAAPEESVEYGARVVVSGKDDAGRVIEIRGDGYVGHDENGNLSGVFHAMPTMLTPDDDDLGQHLAFTEETSWGPKPQGDFVLATYGRAQDWS